MNIVTLLSKVLGYRDQIEQVVDVCGDIAKGRVGVEPHIAQVDYKRDGSQYEITTIARKVFDARDSRVAGDAEAVDVGAALNSYMSNH